jgi:hypothetical protein
MKSSPLFALTLVATLAYAAQQGQPAQPNFSGDWKMSAAKSNFGQLPPPTSFVRKIVQTGASISIVEEQSAGGASSTTTRKLTTDGKATPLELNGMAAACSAVWQGADLIATTAMEGAGLRFTDTMSLSADRKTLTSKVHIATPQGEVDVTVVFDRVT